MQARSPALRRAVKLRKVMAEDVHMAGWTWLVDWFIGAGQHTRQQFLDEVNRHSRKEEGKVVPDLEALEELLRQAFGPEAAPPDEDVKYLVHMLFVSAAHCRKQGRLFVFSANPASR